MITTIILIYLGIAFFYALGIRILAQRPNWYWVGDVYQATGEPGLWIGTFLWPLATVFWVIYSIHFLQDRYDL